MQILVNHLTRMQPGCICLAGIDVHTGGHVRPVVKTRLTTELLATKGGPFDLATCIDLGRTKYVGQAPEFEDHLFDPKAAVCLQKLDAGEFWDCLRKASQEKMVEIFGNHLKPQGQSWAADKGTGKASLGSLALKFPPQIAVGAFNKVRLQFTDGDMRATVGVADIRLYEEDHKTPRSQVVDELARRLSSGVRVILSMGLSRPWTKSEDTVPRHWLQVNNIHLEDNPAWRLV